MLSMEAIIRQVRDIEESERHVLEHVLGHQLKENQQVIIQVVTLGIQPLPPAESEIAAESDQLPEWCNVYEGLTDEQIDDLDTAIRERADLTRPS
jgi:hypothetical protein